MINQVPADKSIVEDDPNYFVVRIPKLDYCYWLESQVDSAVREHASSVTRFQDKFLTYDNRLSYIEERIRDIGIQLDKLCNFSFAKNVANDETHSLPAVSDKKDDLPPPISITNVTPIRSRKRGLFSCRA